MRRVILTLLASTAMMISVGAQYNFSGSVKTEQNNPLTGAYVSIEDLHLSASTDANGKFKIPDIKAGAHQVVVSFLGYVPFKEELRITTDTTLNVILNENVTRFEEVIVSTTRAQNNTPTTFSTVAKTEIQKVALGQDAPYLLSMEPSVVITSDAGTGIGYTGMRIRGSDPTQTNVTINGIPYNDPESQGVYWVDIPDIASSSQSIQVQRGVGTSTNGSGAFGASINFQTDNISQNPFFEYSSSGGSFNTLRNSLHFGTGLIKNHWFMEGKVYGIKSDGYVDRGWADLKSYFGQAGYYGDNNVFKLVAFGGLEETYQAWYGITAADMAQYGWRYNSTGLISDANGVQTFFDKMIDHYQQDNLQLHYVHKFSDDLKFNSALHFTYGRGYYQDYVPGSWGMSLNFFGLPDAHIAVPDTVVTTPGGQRKTLYRDSTVTTTDVIHRLWLDNKFYGGTWGLTYTKGKFSLIWGGAANKYADAKHFGQVIWARYFTDGITGKHYYDNVGNKTDYNTYIKVNFDILEPLSIFADIQYRGIGYKASGLNKEYTDQIVNINKNYSFFNPKVGLFYQYNKTTNAYLSYAVANREPTRSDFTDADSGITPKPERLYDLELGFRHSDNLIYTEVDFFDMEYKNQLVLTGELNGVGTPIRRNAGSSFRRGVEIIAGIKPLQVLRLEGNITLSTNKINDRAQINDSTFQSKKVDIAYSPGIVSGLKLTIIPVRNSEIDMLYKYVGSQYFDNTMDPIIKLSAYSVADVLLRYSMTWKDVGVFTFSLKVNNILNAMYISNARVGSDGVPWYFPQAGRNFLAGVTLRF